MKTNIFKIISIAFLVLAIVMILFFTFQNPHASYELSMSVRDWLTYHGIDIEYATLRTNAHLVEYFILGVALAMFAKVRGYKWWIPMVIGCGVGVLDETVKILLPGREFGGGDMVRDFVGVGIAVTCVCVSFDKRMLYRK